MARHSLRCGLAGLAALAGLFGNLPARAAEAAPGAEPVFARVGDAVITVAEYEATLQNAARQKYYHFRPPEAEVAKLQREVADNMVNRLLLLGEARRRGMQPDRRQVAAALAQYERQYGASEQWKATRDQALPGLTRHLEEKSLLEQVEAAGRQAPEPAESEVLAYFEANPAQFTEPEQIRLSAILLKVDPSAPTQAWEAAFKDAEALVKELRAGADFAEMARKRSGDKSAAAGGNLGYLHRGVLPEEVQQVVDKLKPGEIADPVVVLEGVTLLRLDERRPERARDFADVKGRARDLLIKQREEAAWKAFLAGLRAGVRVEVDESRLLPLPAQAGAAPGTPR